MTSSGDIRIVNIVKLQLLIVYNLMTIVSSLHSLAGLLIMLTGAKDAIATIVNDYDREWNALPV